MKLLDFHCHVYPDAMARRITQAVADFYGVTVGVDIPDVTGTLANVLASQKEASIDLSVLCSVATEPRQVRSINTFLAGCVAKSGGKCLALGTLHPDSADPEGDVEHLLSLGLRGIKLHPDMQGFALDELRTRTLCQAAGNRLPLLIHMGDSRFRRSNPEQLRPLLEAFPETRFVGAHMAGYGFGRQEARELAGRYDNLWVDLSSTAWTMSREEFVDIIRAFGTDRVLFGTDFPMWWPPAEAEVFRALPLTGEEKRAIGWENGAKLLGLAL